MDPVKNLLMKIPIKSNREPGRWDHDSALTLSTKTQNTEEVPTNRKQIAREPDWPCPIGRSPQCFPTLMGEIQSSGRLPNQPFVWTSRPNLVNPTARSTL